MPLAKPSPQPVQLIRLALIAGVLMFGAVALFVHRQPSWKPGMVPSAIGYALLAYAIVAVSIARAMRGRVLREPDPQRRASLLIIGWAVGEGAALFGAVIFFVTGQGQWYLLGLLAMLGVFAFLPIRGAT
jgi:hypothetical protein